MVDIRTPSDLIAALGGAREVAALTRRSTKAVSNWHKRGFPRDFETVVAVQSALNNRGLDVPAWLAAGRSLSRENAA